MSAPTTAECHRNELHSTRSAMCVGFKATTKANYLVSLSRSCATEKTLPTTDTIQNKRQTKSLKSIGIHQNAGKLHKTTIFENCTGLKWRLGLLLKAFDMFST
eukprot:3692346-Amphidinium_carterae.1